MTSRSNHTPKPAEPRTRLRALVESARFRNTIITLIIVNAIILGATTYSLPAHVAQGLVLIDKIIIWIFVAELALKMVALRGAFFRSGWNWFDLVVVAISLVPAAGALSVLRALRVLRLFRLFSVMPEMRGVVEALARAIPGMGAIMMVLALVFYVASVMGAKLFSGTHPEFFADLGASAFTLFQIMTLESWSMGVARPVIAEHPYAWIFFVAFIVITSFAVLNMFIAVIVDSLQSKHFDAETEREAAAHGEREQLIEEVSALRREMSDLKAMLAALQLPDGSSISSAKREDSSE